MGIEDVKIEPKLIEVDSPTFTCSCGNQMKIDAPKWRINIVGLLQLQCPCGEIIHYPDCLWKTNDSSDTTKVNLLRDVVEEFMDSADKHFESLREIGCDDDNDKAFMKNWERLYGRDLNEDSCREVLEFMKK